MNLTKNMFFFRSFNRCLSLCRDDEVLYIESIIKTAGAERGNAIRLLSDWSFIYMDISRGLTLAMAKQVGAARFEENAILSIKGYLPTGFSSIEKTTQFYKDNKALLLEWLSDFDYGRGGDKSLDSMAESLLIDNPLRDSEYAQRQAKAFLNSENMNTDGATHYANDLVLMAYNSLCSSFLDVLDMAPYVSVQNKKDKAYQQPVEQQT